ncbi:TetR/AcrR family transcriptional regulator [Allomuricauda sp. SCSIO 65647]|uniref:TetR/AcrR family transcriptional regulator n=1 Tax=Allomuricauda sp. SCSIO 65647 TaxID=2908843 RepID=UPI001F1A828B|nr:TetR/AcrR family transcriptional regulator [Muricauda sp. SCSIO 65647]UJH69228.1 TetR/AcrR family transcriptional regulator [Muricauda sp. SCSIO 65647]
MSAPDIALHILKTAGSLFYRNGYHNTGINEIIKEAGIAKATLYNHFESKDAICIAYLEDRHRSFISALKAYAERREIGKPALMAIFDYLIDVYRNSAFYGCWASRIYGELPQENRKIAEVIRQQKKDLLLFLEGLVRRNFVNISKAEVEKISGGLYLLYESAMTESYVHKSDWPIYLAKNMAPSLFNGVQWAEKSPD